MNPNLTTIKCRCGKSQMNFFKNIGEFYIDECCTKAGYDHMGRLVEKPREGVEVVQTDCRPSENAAPGPFDPPQVMIPATTQEETPEQKKARLKAEKAAKRAAKELEDAKKRSYNFGGNIKTDGQS